MAHHETCVQSYSLVNGLEKLALVFPHLGVIYFLNQLGVFVNEPCFPEYIGSCVLYLWKGEPETWHVSRHVLREPKTQIDS